jgi:MSHA biogenesis protein MshN
MHMSLINQVLQNVEARQGSPADSWAGQVKPVLSSQPVSSGRWVNRLVGAVLVVAAASWVWLNGPMLLAYLYPQHVTAMTVVTRTTPASSTTEPANKPLSIAAATAIVGPEETTWAAPQLTKSLFSPWHAEPASAKVAVPPAVNKMKPGLTPANPSPPQVEGEFSMKAADHAAVTVATIEPASPLQAGVIQNKIEDEKSADKGLVNKHVRPEQEVNVLIQRAVDHEQKGRLNEALVLLRQALTTTPQSEDARQLLAAYLFESKQDAEAVSVLQSGIKQFPAQVGLSKSLAKWQLAHGQAEAVLQTLKPAANAPLAQDAEAQWMLAMAYQQTGQHTAALPHFERAITLRPGYAQWMVAYAISLQAAGQNAQALQQLQQAQSLPLSERLLEFVTQRIRQLGGNVQASAD